MRPPDEVDRGQAIQVGAVLLFGFLVIAFSGYQAFVLPEQNADVEFTHNQEVQQDMLELRNGILGTASTGSGRPVTVTLGTGYPARALATNPPPTSGAVRTVSVGARDRFTVNNTEGQNDETADYWDGTTNRTFDTRAIRYRPSYNELDSAPSTVYEHSVLYNRGARNGGVSTKTEQALVNGRTISLVAVRGEIDRAGGGAVSVDPNPDSAPPRTVSVTDGSGPIQVTLESNLSESTWRELLDPELDPDTAVGDPDDGDDQYLAAASCANPDPCGTLTLTFETGVSYELRLAGVSVGRGSVSTSPVYTVSIEGDETSIAEGGSQRLVAEVRDEYNNPVSGVSLNGSIEDPAGGGDTLDTSSVTTNEDGRATFVYEAPNNVNGNEVADIAVSFGAETPATTATFNVTVMNSDGSGGGGGGSSLSYVSGSGRSVGPSPDSGLEFDLENTASGSVDITAITIDSTSNAATEYTESNGGDGRFNREAFFNVDASPDSRNDPADGYVEEGSAIGVGGSASLDNLAQLSSGDVATVYVYEFVDSGGNAVDMSGSTVQITIEYKIGGSTETTTFSFTA